VPAVLAAPQPVFARHRPELTTLYEVVRDNLETLYAAVDDGALSVGLPAFVRKELDGYLDCGLLCRGFGRLRCERCHEGHLVAFSCKGRGFCPSCLGRRMASTAANLIEHVLPPSPLRQWVLTVPFAWRARLAYDGELLGAVTRVCVSTILGFYTARMKREGVTGGQSGAVVVVQRTSSDLKLNPHLHIVFLDGVYRELDAETVGFTALPHLSTREVGEVLETICKRIVKHLRRRGLLGDGERDLGPKAEADEGLSSLAVSAVSGQSPPAGPEWRRSLPLPPLAHAPLGFDKPLCANLDGFTLHAATRARWTASAARRSASMCFVPPSLRSASRAALTASSASPSSAPSPTARWPSTSTRCRYSRAWPPPCPRPGYTPSATRACSPLQASSARASCPRAACPRRPPTTSTRRLRRAQSEVAAATVLGPSF